MFTRQPSTPEFESTVPYLYDPRTRESRHSAGNKAPKAPGMHPGSVGVPWLAFSTRALDMRRSWYRCT